MITFNNHLPAVNFLWKPLQWILFIFIGRLVFILRKSVFCFLSQFLNQKHQSKLNRLCFVCLKTKWKRQFQLWQKCYLAYVQHLLSFYALWYGSKMAFPFTSRKRKLVYFKFTSMKCTSGTHRTTAGKVVHDYYEIDSFAPSDGKVVMSVMKQIPNRLPFYMYQKD